MDFLRNEEPIKYFCLFAVLLVAGCTGMDEKTLSDAAKIFSSSQGGEVSQQEAGLGLKAALEQGIEKGAQALSQPGAYLKDSAIKILLPPEARKAEEQLRQMGLGVHADRVIQSLNAAAEDAANDSVPIFSSAIRQITFSDAMAILLGPRDSATKFLQEKTTEQLIASYRPKVTKSLDKVSATKYWADFAKVYNDLGKRAALLSGQNFKELNADLPGYTTERAVSGLFAMVRTEEANIRENPVARTTDLLKRVFDFAANRR